MKNDELIKIWQEGNETVFKDQKIDRNMITQYLSDKTLKGTRTIQINIIFYELIQLANLILLSMNLEGYMNNPTMIWILIPQVVITVGILLFGVKIYLELRKINNFSDSLSELIRRHIQFFGKSYELWLIISSVSVIILSSNVNLYIDNNNGSYVINNHVMYVGVTLAALLFIYGAQKISSTRNLRALRAYLDDFQKGVLEQSERIERSKKKYLWLWLSIFLLLSAAMIAGIYTAIR